MTTSNYGRANVPWPNLGSPAGAPLHAELTGGIGFIGNNLSRRWSGSQVITASGTFSFQHDLGLASGNLRIRIYESGSELSAAQVTSGFSFSYTNNNLFVITNTGVSTRTIELYVEPIIRIRNVDLDPAFTVSTTGDVTAANITATGLMTAAADPVSALQVATKQYADSLFVGVKWKTDARAASTGNLTLSGTQTVDGVALIAADRVLVKNQTTGSENGIYLVAAGAWTRTTDADTSTKILGAQVSVQEGTVNADRSYRLITDSITLGTTSLVFSLAFGPGTYAASATGLILTGNVFSIALDGTSLVQSGLGLKVNISGAPVGTTDSQTLTNKTLTSPSITTPTGIVKGDVGLGNVDNTSDATKNSATATLTNKTLGSTNTLTGATAASFTNATFTITLPSAASVTLASLTGTEAFTNKDYDGGTASNTSRLTIPKGTFSAISALTRKQGTILYASDQNALYSDNGTSLSPIGGNWTVASAVAVASGGTIAISLTTGLQLIPVSGSGGAQTTSLTPFGTSAPSDGVVIRLLGTSNTNTVTIGNNDASKGVLVNGDVTLGRGSSIDFQYNLALDLYFEVSRNAILGV